MQKHLKSFLNKEDKKTSLHAFSTNPISGVQNFEIDDVIIQKQLEVLEHAIKQYNKLEEIKKYSKMVLEDIDYVTEEDILNALELEKKISIEDEIAVQKLLQSEGLLKDIYGDDF